MFITGGLATFENAVNQLQQPSDEDVLACIQQVVLALNAIQEQFNGDAYATGERELLCDYIDQTLTEAGVDLDDVARRQHVPRTELTDEWRTW
jgi:hypothetical protein